MTVTSGDVAKAAGVSRPAVSMILNGRGNRFSAETVRRVEQTAQAMNYRPSAAARTLATGTSDLVVALIPNTTFGTNLQDITDLFTTAFARVGLTLVLRFSSHPLELFEHFIATVRPRAVIAPLGHPTPAERAALAAAKIPLIDWSEQSERGDPHMQIGRVQGEYLASRGYRTFAYAHLHDTRLDVFGDAREAGFLEQLRTMGLPEPRSIRLSLTLQDAVAALRELPEPVAIACYNDDVAIALLSAARELGRRVPEDVALMGVDATKIGALMSPRITTIGGDLAAGMDGIVRSTVEKVIGTDAAPHSPEDVVFEVVRGESA